MKTAKRPQSSRLLLVLINLLSIGCLIWTLREAKLGELKDDLLTMDWRWVALAVAADVGVYCWHALRWSLLLRPVVSTGYWRTVRAIYVGLLANEILPFRAGELLRTYLLSRWTQLPFSVSLSSALIERVFDGLWLCSCVFLTLKLIPMPPQFRFLVDGAWVLGAVVIAGALLLAFAMFRHQRQTPIDRPQHGWRRQVAILLEDLGLIGHSRYLYFAFLQSLPYLLLQVIPIWAAFRGYGFDLSISAGFALMVILRLGSVVPQAPGNLGLFQLLTKEALVKIFDVVPAEAARFSLVLWGIVTIPLLMGGLIALSVEEADIVELKRAAEDHAATLKSQRQEQDWL